MGACRKYGDLQTFVGSIREATGAAEGTEGYARTTAAAATSSAGEYGLYVYFISSSSELPYRQLHKYTKQKASK